MYTFTRFDHALMLKGSVLGIVTAVLLTVFTCLISSDASADTPKSHATSAKTEAGKPRLRLRIAVDQFSVDDIQGEAYTLPRDVRKGLQAALINKLNACGYFQAMERDAQVVQSIQIEGRIDREKREGQTDPAGIVLPPRQKLTPARYIITPNITGYQVTSNGRIDVRTPFGRIGDKKTSLKLALNLRICDAETGAILETATAEGRQDTKENAESFKLGRIGFDGQQASQNPINQVVEKAAEDAVAKITARLKNEPWSATVAAQDTGSGRIIINVGTDAGVETGMEFDVFRTGGKVIDPDTGDTLTQGDEVKIGRIKVFRMDRGAAYCDVLDGTKFEVKNIVRLTK